LAKRKRKSFVVRYCLTLSDDYVRVGQCKQPFTDETIMTQWQCCRMLYVFSNQKCQFGEILECLAMKDIGKFYVRLLYVTIVQTFGIFYGDSVYFVVTLVYFFPFWYVVPRKIWQPCSMRKS
jgi:hypothetical protein